MFFFFFPATDKVRVVLLHNGKISKCYGTVHIEVNGTAERVCGSTLDKDYHPEVICEELGCGSVSFDLLHVYIHHVHTETHLIKPA